MREQIQYLFENPQKVMRLGLWISGYENEGELISWHKNGQLHSQRSYKNGQKDGEFKYWNEDGELDIHRLYKDGEIVEYLK